MDNEITTKAIESRLTVRRCNFEVETYGCVADLFNEDGKALSSDLIADEWDALAALATATAKRLRDKKA